MGKALSEVLAASGTWGRLPGVGSLSEKGYISDMRVHEIEAAIAELTPEELAEFAAWFEEYQAKAWDEQIARDVRAGRFDPLIQRAREQIKAGEGRPL